MQIIIQSGVSVFPGLIGKTVSYSVKVKKKINKIAGLLNQNLCKEEAQAESVQI